MLTLLETGDIVVVDKTGAAGVEAMIGAVEVDAITTGATIDLMDGDTDGRVLIKLELTVLTAETLLCIRGNGVYWN